MHYNYHIIATTECKTLCGGPESKAVIPSISEVLIGSKLAELLVFVQQSELRA